MRARTSEPKHTFSIYLPNYLYKKVVDKAGRGNIGTFIREILEEKLIKEEQAQKEKFQQKLITGYKRVANSKKRQAEAEIWDETLNDVWKKDE